MTTFDHETAWIEAAAPAYRSLPSSVLDLLSRVAIRCADLRQLPDCSMPWLDGDSEAPETLRAEFQALDSETLSFSARVIYFAGHWKPSRVAESDRIELPGLEHGSSLKFAHYADQILRERFGLPARGSSGNGIGLAVHEGAIRVTYSSRNTWTSSEVAPATDRGLDYARTCISKLSSAIADVPLRNRHQRDSEASDAMETIRKSGTSGDQWPNAWRALIYTDRYMVQESVVEQRRLARMPAPDFEAMIAKLDAEHDKKIALMQTERAGLTWLLRRKYPTSNVIYYDHVKTFSFGWRQPLTAAEVSTVLDFISEFPYPYELKCADGRKLQGNIG